MAFTPKDWRDYPDLSTPITATALEDLETRLGAYTDASVVDMNEGIPAHLAVSAHAVTAVGAAP